MASITENFRESYQESIGRRFNWEYFLQDNVTGSWMQTIWVVVLFLVTLAFTGRQWVTFPTETTVILVIWLIGIVLAALDGLHLYHSRVGQWLRSNLLGSVSNALLTLFLALLIYAIT
jgi:TRAP-type C4-dicarboxylate transport system permease small subunit